jgi:hypothetical protein
MVKYCMKVFGCILFSLLPAGGVSLSSCQTPGAVSHTALKAGAGEAMVEAALKMLRDLKM